MSETLTPQTIVASELVAQQALPETYFAHLDKMAISVPEVADKREAITTASAEIVAQCAIEPTLFDDEARSAIFTGIASRWAENTGKEGEAAKNEHAFLMDTLTLLAYEHSPVFSEFVAEIEGGESMTTSEQKMQTYDRYTDPRLSAEITNAIQSGLLNETKQKLGITPENEDLYEVRVLTIDANGDTALGLNAPDYTDFNDMPEDRAARIKVFEDEKAIHDQVNAYKDGLIQRANDFAAELGEESLFAPGWVTKVGDKTLLCITMPLAEKILDKSLTENSRYYSEDEYTRDLAFLKHEYVHTQGRLDVDKHGLLGINLEERRAEYFSGDKHGYDDVKGLLRDVNIVSGLDVVDILESRPKGGTAAEVYADIAANIGLDSMVELLAAAPRNYLTKQGNRFLSNAMEAIGDYDGVIQRLLQKSIDSGKNDEVEARITERAERIVKVFGDDSERIAGYVSYVKMSGLHIVTDMVSTRANQIIENHAA